MSIRSNTVKTAAVALLAAGAAVLMMMLLFPGTGGALVPAAGPLVRVAADYDFDGESSTETLDGDGGEVLYAKTVFPPSNANTLYITFSGTGDQHSDAVTMMKCYVNGVACSGDEWVRLQLYDDFDFHDNNINYTWCKAITPGAGHRNVELRLASSNGGTVYVEQMHFYVDAAFTPHGCTEIVAGLGGDAPTPAGHGG